MPSSSSNALVPSSSRSRSSSSSNGQGYMYEKATMERIQHTNGATTESASLFKTDGHSAEFEYKSRTSGGAGLALEFSHRPSHDLTSRMQTLRIGGGQPAERERERTGSYKGAVTISREPSRRESVREPSRRESNAGHTHRSAVEQERLVINGGVGRSASQREPSRRESHREPSHREPSHREPSHRERSRSTSHHSAAPAPLAGAGFSQAQGSSHHGSSSRHGSSGHSHRPSASHHGSSHHTSSSYHGSSFSRAHGTPYRASQHPMAAIAEESASHRSSSSKPSASRSGATKHIEASGTTKVADRVATKFER
ncbi:hypothetical protein MMC30_003949 [Trapelia coarctata]|nr:hypothetical protein [Trapelia coarctata]